MADYTNVETVKALGNMHPELEELLKTVDLPAADWSDLAKVRAFRHELELSRMGTAEQQKLESTLKIRMRDGFESEVRIHKPANPPAKSPLVVLYFGGGFVVGSNLQLGPYARAIAQLYGATVVTINYRLAPEHKFPTAPHDAWDSTVWLAENAASFGADPSAGFVIGGVSAGGNLTAVVAQKAVSEGLSPPITGLWVCVPVLLTHETVPEKEKHLFFSREQNAKAPVFNQHAIDAVDGYLGQDHKSPEFSPFNVPGAHKALPKSYFQVCGLDPLRDDGLIYERTLRENGVETKMDVYPGVPHAHFSLVPQLKISQKASVDTIMNFGWLLGQKPASVENVVKSFAPPAGA